MGRVVSADPADDKLFIVGWSHGLIVRGPLLNRQGIRENEPGKPDYILNEQPAEAIYTGPAWFSTWDTVKGNTVPKISDIVMFRESDGLIGFLDDGASIPAGYKPLLASVKEVDLTTNGVKVDFMPQNMASLPTEDET